MLVDRREGKMNLLKIILVILLIICTIEDMKEKAVTMPVVYGFGLIGLLMQGYLKNISVWSVIGGMGIGILIIGISHLTKGGIGMGDGILIVVTGIYLGLRDNFILLLAALTGVLIWAGFLAVTKGISRNKEIPFIPFMLAAYLGMLTL